MNKFILTLVLAVSMSWIAGSRIPGAEATMKLATPVFEHEQMIPRKYTCQGQDINPPLAITGIPAGTKSLALIIDDPDAPGGNWDHWLVYNIAPTPEIRENSVPGTEIRNDFGKVDYGGPCPPSGTHRYFFKLYALDTTLIFKGAPSKEALEKAMQGHVLEKAELVGLYQKTR